MLAPALIVSSNDDLALLLKTIAQINGYQALVCANTEEALALAACQPIGMVFLDTPIADRSLQSCIHQLRARHLSVPIVLLSTDDDTRFDVEVLALDGFLCKPFAIPQIVAWLRMFDQSQERGVSRTRAAASMQRISYRGVESGL